MQDEAEEPNTETNRRKPTFVELLLVAAAWGLLVVTLFAGFRLWSGGSH
jgi:hypothetical protein